LENTRENRVRELLEAGEQALRKAGVASWRLDAELLLAAAAGMTRAELLAGGNRWDLLASAKAARFARLVERRAAREPIAYILGRKEFHSLDLEVGPAVLIPRPETETLVEVALEILRESGGTLVIDVGTGSGAIGLAIAAEAPRAHIVATDLSVDALAVARRNAERLGMAGRIETRHADFFSLLDGGSPLRRFDLIVSNPPYIADTEIPGLQPEVSRYEPRVALAGGPDGMGFYRVMAREAPAHLAARGHLMVETGAGQAGAVATIFRAAGFAAVLTRNDLAGIPRVVCAGAWAGRP
jgi:release factor glutamine methyltransferase